ncbi:uncharacterized protein LOC144207736 [Stigmatopora nigra]
MLNRLQRGGGGRPPKEVDCNIQRTPCAHQNTFKSTPKIQAPQIFRKNNGRRKSDRVLQQNFQKGEKANGAGVLKDASAFSSLMAWALESGTSTHSGQLQDNFKLRRRHLAAPRLGPGNLAGRPPPPPPAPLQPSPAQALACLVVRFRLRFLRALMWSFFNNFVPSLSRSLVPAAIV